MQADQVKVEPRLSSISCSGDRQECPPNCNRSSTQTGTLLIVWMLTWGATIHNRFYTINNNACTVASLQQQLSGPNHASLLVTPVWKMHQRKLVLMPICAASEDAQRQPCCVGQRRVRRRGQGASRLAMSASQVWLGQASPWASHRPSSPGEPLFAACLSLCGAQTQGNAAAGMERLRHWSRPIMLDCCSTQGRSGAGRAPCVPASR